MEEDKTTDGKGAKSRNFRSSCTTETINPPKNIYKFSMYSCGSKCRFKKTKENGERERKKKHEEGKNNEDCVSN